MTYRIREVFKLINKKNPISGHEWFEYGPTTSYEVVGPTGVVSTHRTQAGADKAKAEWDDYAAKFNIHQNES